MRASLDAGSLGMSPAYKRYVLGILTTVYMLNLVDRGLMMLLLQPIKTDLDLTDTQLGFLTGIAFGLFYATLGVPIARWADRGNRVTVTSMAIGLWGLTVMACLFVTSYFQLVLSRIAAAVGESGCKPPTYSLVGDYFPKPGERTRALSIYMTGNFCASLVSFIVGGWLSELYGWRTTFFVMGIPGLLLALLVKLTIIEPRTFEHRGDDKARQQPSMKLVLKTLWELRTLRHLSIALILLYTMNLGLGPWYVAFMIRSHAMGTAELGVWMGLIFGLSGIVGSLLGGYVATRWFDGNERSQVRLSAVTVACVVPFYLGFLLLPQKYAALMMLAPLMTVFSMFLGPTYALMQRLVADGMRATMLALVMLLANLIGFGMGPQLVGILSDAFAPTLGTDSLRYAMLAMSFVACWAGWHFWHAGRTVGADLKIRDE
jgi:predicted MFS family arabinose efflux permease